MKKKDHYLTIKEKIKLSFIAFFLLLFIVALILRSNQAICEWWTTHISRAYQNVMGRFSSIFPFSLLEIWFIILIVGIITFTVIMIVAFAKKKKNRAFHSLSAAILMIIATLSIFQSSFGIGYGRDPVDIPQYEQNVSYKSYDDLIQYYLDDLNLVTDQVNFNDDGSVISPYTFEELSAVYQEEFKKLDSDYFTQYTARAKKLSLSSWLYTELWITGVFFAPSGDANINYMIPNSELPFTMAHEIAHSKGVMREDDANLVSLYINLTSDIPYLKYSAYQQTFASIMALAEFMNDESAYAKFYDQIDSRFIKNQETRGNFWNSHKTIKNFGNWINNLYLIINGNKDGTGSYDDNYDSGEGTIIDPDTGEEEVVPIITEYSPYQKLYFYLYPGILLSE